MCVGLAPTLFIRDSPWPDTCEIRPDLAFEGLAPTSYFRFSKNQLNFAVFITDFVLRFSKPILFCGSQNRLCFVVRITDRILRSSTPALCLFFFSVRKPDFGMRLLKSALFLRFSQPIVICGFKNRLKFANAPPTLICGPITGYSLICGPTTDFNLQFENRLRLILIAVGKPTL